MLNYQFNLQCVKSSRSQLKKQSGITLIVVLVLLAAITFLGLAAFSDSNLQFVMVRNNQLQSYTHTAALTEISAQLDRINVNDPKETDEILVRVIQNGVDEDLGDGIDSKTLDLINDNSDFVGKGQLTDAGLVRTLTLTDTGVTTDNQIVVGFTIGDRTAITHRIFEINSTAGVQVNNDANRVTNLSDQTQGFRYPAAN